MGFKTLFRKKSATQILLHSDASAEHHSMNKVLRVKDLTFFGIAAIIGGGTFSAIGNACYSGGPAVIFLYIICAIACGFTAMCYAEFASRVPVSGSAYTYAYVTFGELFAWIIGWALLMEYSIGNIYIAFSWSGYFTNLLEAMGANIPAWLTINYKEAHRAFLDTKLATEGYTAWMEAPQLNGLRIIFDLPAVLINILITWLVYIGTKESRNISNAMVIIKLAVIVLIIIVGVFYVDIDNWHPFMPNGFLPKKGPDDKMIGVMAGISAVFFAYIGFDAVSTLAEECENPQRDLPRGMIYSLIICTVVFIILCLVLTGMASYTLLGVSDPLAEIFKIKGVKWMLFIVSTAAVIAMSSVLLVFQMGQPRIWMTMSRDGLLPKRFASIHPKYKTPGFATIITGLVVGLPLFFTDEKFVLDFTSIGTLFAFVLVCGGILMLPRRTDDDEVETKGKFKMPYINAKWIISILLVLTITLLFTFNKNATLSFITNEKKINDVKTIITSLNAQQIDSIKISISKTDSLAFSKSSNDLEKYMNTLNETNYTNLVQSLPIDESIKYERGWNLFKHKIPIWVFIFVCFVSSVFSFIKNLSLIPVLGLLSCCYLLTGMEAANWKWFSTWLLIGLVVYFSYGYRKSKLAKQTNIY